MEEQKKVENTPEVIKKKRGRPKLYQTDDERRAVKSENNKKYRLKQKIKKREEFKLGISGLAGVFHTEQLRDAMRMCGMDEFTIDQHGDVLEECGFNDENGVIRVQVIML